jgi:hypothetical protein
VNCDKLAAHVEVCTLEPGSIVWELEDEPEFAED